MVALLETFIAGCYEKSEEIDDSNGAFGMFVEDLFCDWIRVRHGAKADAVDTATRLTAFERAVRERPCGGGDP